MNTIDYSTPSSQIPPVPLGGHARGASQASDEQVDLDLVQQTRAEIRRIVREITQLCRSDVPTNEFYETFLARVTSALAAVGGALWLRPAQGPPRLRYQINLAETGLAENDTVVAEHAVMLDQLAMAGQSVAVPPESASAGDELAKNPTPWMLLLGTFAVDEQVTAIVEIFQRADGGPVTQRGYLRFLTQMCELADDFMKNRRLRELNREQARWRDTEQFLTTIHGRLDLQATAYAVANEGRRLINVDRASVIVRRRDRCRVLSISGLDTINHRADQVQCLADLVKAVTDVGESLWHPASDLELPPQIEQALQRYLDQSHARMVGVVPLVADNAPHESRTDERASPMGAMVVERFEDSAVSDTLRRQTNRVARHASIALSNALEHRNASASPLIKALARLKTALGRNALTKSLAGIVAILAIAFVLCFVPATLRIDARGSLRPCAWQNVFAQVDGTVEVLAVRHGQIVQAGQVLARLRNAELDMEVTALTGNKQTISEQILATQRQLLLLKHGQHSAEQRSRLTADLEQLEQRLEGVEGQLALQRHRRESLVVRSPVAGRVVTWDVENALAARPVRRGQVLMTVVDPTGDWEVELRIDERDAGHVIAAAGLTGTSRATAAAIDVPLTFSLRTYPGQEFTGRIVAIDRTAQESESGQNLVVARAWIDTGQLPELRSGATAHARIDCGKRSIGFVWFRDLIELVHTEVLLWF